MGISQKCWVLQSKADNCYLTKNLGAFKLKRTFLCTREWWLQYLKCWDPPWCQFGYVSHQIWTNYVIWVEHRGFNTLSIIAIDRAAIILQSVFPYQTLLKSALIQRIQTGGVKQKRTKYKENLKVQLFSFILYGDKKLYSVTSMLFQRFEKWKFVAKSQNAWDGKKMFMKLREGCISICVCIWLCVCICIWLCICRRGGMGDARQYCLKWNNHPRNVAIVFDRCLHHPEHCRRPLRQHWCHWFHPHPYCRNHQWH